MSKLKAITPKQASPITKDRILLLKDGDLDLVGADLRLEQADADRILARFAKQGNAIPIDYHHASMKVEETKQGKAPAAGWINNLEYVPGEGLYGTDLEWTSQAQKEIADSQFKFVSPVIIVDEETDDLELLHSVALTNRPRTRHMDPLLEAADLADLIGDIDMASKKTTKKVAGADALPPADGGGDVIMTVTPEQKALVKLMELLGVQDGAPLVDVLNAAIDKLGGGSDTGSGDTTGDTGNATAADAGLKQVAATLGVKVEDLEKELPALKLKSESLEAVTNRLKVVEAQLGEVKAAEKKAKTDALVDEVIEAGKLLPDDTKAVEAARSLADKDPDSFKAIYASMSPIVAPGSVVAGTVAAKGEREKIIAAAGSEFDSDPSFATQCGKHHWINVDLVNAGLDEMTETEIKSLA